MYFDYNATAPLPPSLRLEFVEWFKETDGLFYNPSGRYSLGRKAAQVGFEISELILDSLGLSATGDYELYWTSGATEANSWLVHCLTQCDGLETVYVSGLEHDSLALSLQRSSFSKIEVLSVSSSGQVVLDPSPLRSPSMGIKKSTAVAFITAAHNETGVLQPLEVMSRECRNLGIELCIDAAQVYTKESLPWNQILPSALVLSAHKMGGPIGLGALIVKKSFSKKILKPFIHGHQQKGLRGGTASAFLQAWWGKVIQEHKSGRLRWPKELQSWHFEFEKKVLKKFPKVRIFGNESSRLVNTTFFSFPYRSREAVVAALDEQGICISTGSACSSGSALVSPALLAMGVDLQTAKSALRISSGFENKKNDFDTLLSALENLI